MQVFKVGDRVEYKAGGKVSRLEGVAGKWMPATVTAFDTKTGDVHIDPDHRQKPDADFQGMGAVTTNDPKLIRPLDISKIVNDPPAGNWAQAVADGLASDDLGKAYMTAGQQFKVIGYNRKAYKRPIIIERRDGKQFKAGIDHVKLCLRANPVASW